MPTSIMLGIPTLDFSIQTQLASFLLELCTGKVDPSTFRFEVCFVAGVAPVAFARNTLVGAFLQSRADALWFIDADITPTPAVLRMLEIDADIVSGRAPIVRPGDDGELVIVHAAFAERLASGGFTYAGTGAQPLPIVACGAGCLLIRRAVLEDPRLRLSPHYVSPIDEPCTLEDDPVAAPAIFRTPTKPNGEPLIGEDMDFVYRAHRLGYQCAFDAAAACGHVKRVDLAGVEAMIRRAIAR
jgi:hypothetical protein